MKYTPEQLREFALQFKGETREMLEEFAKEGYRNGCLRRVIAHYEEKLGIIVRNVRAGAVHLGWAGDFAQEALTSGISLFHAMDQIVAHKAICRHYDPHRDWGCTSRGSATGNCLRNPGKYPPCPIQFTQTTEGDPK